jgi:PTH2 family peptidyl-tRNA hydrolase
MRVKQVLIIRNDLNINPGQVAAFCSHASMAVLFNLIKDPAHGSISENNGDYQVSFKHQSEALHHFMTKSFKKIVVYVNSEQELLDIYNKAEGKGLLRSLIKDSVRGLSEQHFVSVAVGPGTEEEINEITGHLPLY